MKKCKSCQTEIDDKAKKCPHCQTDQRNWFAKHPILTVIIVLIVIGIFGSSGGKDKNNKGTDTQVNQGDNQTQPGKVEVKAEKVNVRDFGDDFDENQVAAETKWGGKLIEFSAKISNITDSGISFYDVASKEFSGTQISCRIVDKQQLMSLKNGQVVTVRGVVGTQTIGVIGIDDCQVIE